MVVSLTVSCVRVQTRRSTNPSEIVRHLPNQVVIVEEYHMVCAESHLHRLARQRDNCRFADDEMRVRPVIGYRVQP